MKSKVFNIIAYPFKWLYHLYRNIFFLRLPNLSFFMSKRLIYKQLPRFEQKLIFSGKGVINIGSNCVFGCRIGGFHRRGAIELQARYPEAKISIGNNIATNNNLFICAAQLIKIEDDTLIGQAVTIMDHEAHGTDPMKRRQPGEKGEVIIGRNVWIGNNVIILKNTYIGENTIVAAGSVVSGSFPDNVIIGGVPAKIIKPL